MRSRPDPNPDGYKALRKQLLQTTKVQRALKALKEDPDSLDLSSLKATELLVVTAEVDRARFGSVGEGDYERAWRETMPVAAAPKRDHPIRDLLEHSLGQPEMQEAWRTWTGPRGKRGPEPNYAHAKAMMLFCAGAGLTQHVLALDSLFKVTSGLPEFFGAYDAQAHAGEQPPLPGMTEHLDVPPIPMYSYPQLRVHMPRLAEPGIAAAWTANIKMLQALRDYFPLVGRAAFIDGTAYPSWSRQIWGGERGSALDRRLRGRDDDAGFRAYAHGPVGKVDVDLDAGTFKLFRTGKVKAWRGYYWIVLVDQATGLPLIAVMQDAAINEYLATERLLDRLYERWPDIGLERLIADAGWDNGPQAKLILTKYGAQPIFRAGNQIGDRAITTEGKSLAITARGEVLCPHGACHHVGMPAVPREGLSPGEAAPDGQFRVRVICPLEKERLQAERAGDIRRTRDLATRSCGKLSVRSEHHWARLGHYPHHGLGRPDLYAQRQVDIVRLTQIESFINRIKSLGLANPGAARARMALLVEHEAFMSLGSATLTALTLADQRRRRGITFHVEPGGRGPTSPRDHARQIVQNQPTTVAVGNDPHAARRAAFRVIPGGQA
jgi:hypothetical protein